MSLVYIFAASGVEGQPVRRIAVSSGSNSHLRCGTNDLVLVTTGMGPANARNKAEAALLPFMDAYRSPKPDAVLIIGLCGALNASLPERRIVAYTECRATDATKPLLRCSGTIVDSAIELLKGSSIFCDRVVGITSPRIATTPDERHALAQYGAAVVDMESYFIVEAASAAGVSAAVLRVVSDSFYRKLPDFNRALKNDGSLDGWKALRVALGSPLRTCRLLAANNRAVQDLARALDLVLNTSCFA
jgi:nucleoside phosphorylase